MLLKIDTTFQRLQKSLFRMLNIKYSINLFKNPFLVPRIKIVDERHQEVEDRIFYDRGSTIKLKCMVENIVGEQPEYIIWKKGNRMLNYDTERGGIR